MALHGPPLPDSAGPSVHKQARGGPELSPSQPPWRSQAQDPEGLAVQNLAPGPLKPDVEADTFPRCGWGLDTLDPVDPSLTALNAGFSTR